MSPITQLIDVDALSREIAAAAREVFPGQNWHVGALGPTEADPRWTVVVRRSELVAPLFVVREKTLAEGLCGLTARVLEAATQRCRDAGPALDVLVRSVNAIANAGMSW